MKTGGGSGNRSGPFGENGLIALTVRGFIGALDVGWKRNMAEALEMPADIVLVTCNKMKSAQAKLTAREHLGFQLPLTKQNPLSDLYLAARTHQDLPSPGIELAGKKDLDFSRQMFWSPGTRWGLRIDADSSPEEARRDDPRVV